MIRAARRARRRRLRSTTGVAQKRSVSRSSRRELGFERRNARGELFIFGAGERGHFTHRLELLARNEVHAGHQALDLALGERFDLAPRAIGKAGRIGHQAREVVQYAAARLWHRGTPGEWKAAYQQCGAPRPLGQDRSSEARYAVSSAFTIALALAKSICPG